MGPAAQPLAGEPAASTGDPAAQLAALVDFHTDFALRQPCVRGVTLQPIQDAGRVQGYDPRLLYTTDLREYQGLDVEFAPARGIFSAHHEYARWYATWWAYRMMDVIEHYDPDFIYTDGNSTQPFTGLKSGTGLKADAMQRVAAHYFNRTLARRGAVDTFGVVKFSPPRAGLWSGGRHASLPPTSKGHVHGAGGIHEDRQGRDAARGCRVAALLLPQGDDR